MLAEVRNEQAPRFHDSLYHGVDGVALARLNRGEMRLRKLAHERDVRTGQARKETLARQHGSDSAEVAVLDSGLPLRIRSNSE